MYHLLRSATFFSTMYTWSHSERSRLKEMVHLSQPMVALLRALWQVFCSFCFHFISLMAVTDWAFVSSVAFFTALGGGIYGYAVGQLIAQAIAIY